MLTKKVTVIVSIVLFLLAAGGSYYYFGYFLKNQASLKQYQSTLSTSGSPDELGGPKTQPCPMNGKLYSKAQEARWEGRRPMGVMIENHTDARPQSGLSSADVIYEAVAEGGITRFLAIFYCQDAKVIGPVRSARMYFLKMLQGYGQNPLYAHVGGANTPGPADALGEIQDLGWDGYNDMNQFAVPFPYYYRDYERLPNRATEHTMYAATLKLFDYAKKARKLTNTDEDGVSWDKGFTPWKFKDEAPASQRGNVSKISFPFWSQFGGDYSVVWSFDKKTDSYVRSNGGSPHVDHNTGKPITAKDVVVMFTDESPANDGYPGGHLVYDVVGSGDGLLFQDGKATKITWKKPDEEQMVRFYEGGKEVSLVRGLIFVEILPIGNKVTY